MEEGDQVGVSRVIHSGEICNIAFTYSDSIVTAKSRGSLRRYTARIELVKHYYQPFV